MIETEHENITLGVKRTAPNTYANLDGTWTFSNWYIDQPTDNECVFTSDLNGFGWNTTLCSQPGYIVCQLNTSLPLPSIIAVPIINLVLSKFY